MCSETLCTPNDDGFHTKKSIDRTFTACGVDKLQLNKEELRTCDLYGVFRICIGQIKTDETKKLMLLKNVTKSGVLFQCMKKLLNKFPAYNMKAKWQTRQLKHLLRDLPLNHCVSIYVFFSENYRCCDN